MSHIQLSSYLPFSLVTPPFDALKRIDAHGDIYQKGAEMHFFRIAECRFANLSGQGIREMLHRTLCSVGCPFDVGQRNNCRMLSIFSTALHHWIELLLAIP